MRRSKIQLKGIEGRRVGRVSSLAVLHRSWRPDLHYFVRVDNTDEAAHVAHLRANGISNTSVLTKDASIFLSTDASAILDAEAGLIPDDVVAVTSGNGAAEVLYRNTDIHHSVFITNRCNSYCVMCSQPPTARDDSWLLDEAEIVARHIGISPRTVGFTGGEPLLAGSRLRAILDTYRELHPGTALDVLTNARLLGDSRFASMLLSGLDGGVTWMVPLYGHADFLHDFVVQRPGAFEETIAGLLELQRHHQEIQLRIVLIQPVLERLVRLADYISRNLPFVSQVAFMGCEPTGFARANVDMCRVDYEPFHGVLAAAVDLVEASGIRPIIMNIPLCVLSADLRRHAHRSISDWKATYAPECTSCSARSGCCGLFASHEEGWRPGVLRPFTHGDAP